MHSEELLSAVAHRDTESQFEARPGIGLARPVGSWWDIASLLGHLSGDSRVESVSSRARVVVRDPVPGIYSDEEMPS